MSHGLSNLKATWQAACLFDDEQRRQHDDRDVVMAGSPARRLIVGQAAFSYALIWIGTFDRLYLIVLTGLTSPRTIRYPHRAGDFGPSQTETSRCAR
jgi:hypothetical protein